MLQSYLGMLQSYLGMLQSYLGLLQSDLGMLQSELGLFQSGIAGRRIAPIQTRLSFGQAPDRAAGLEWRPVEPVLRLGDVRDLVVSSSLTQTLSPRRGLSCSPLLVQTGR